MFRYCITKLENGKYYGECAWQNKKDTVNVDVVNCDERYVEQCLQKGTMKMIQARLREFLRWRYNSLTKADRLLWESTVENMNHMHDIACKLDYINMAAGVRILWDNQSRLYSLKPTTENYLWNDMQTLIHFAGCIYQGAVMVEINDNTMMEQAN